MRFRDYLGGAVPQFMEAFMIIGRSLKFVGLHLWKIMTSRLEIELLNV